MNMMKAHKKKI